jgi:hypothetical protein
MKDGKVMKAGKVMMNVEVVEVVEEESKVDLMDENRTDENEMDEAINNRNRNLIH